MPANITYQTDYTGVSPLNLVKNETQVLQGAQGADFYFIVPENAPFFRKNFSLTYTDGAGAQRNLVEHVDFEFTHKFIEASDSIGMDVFGSISLLRPDIKGMATLTYQTIGSPWTLDTVALTKFLAAKQLNPRVASWAQINGLPYAFPVVNHPFNVTDMVGQTELVNAINALAATVASKTPPVATLQTMGGVPKTQYDADMALVRSKLGI